MEQNIVQSDVLVCSYKGVEGMGLSIHWRCGVRMSKGRSAAELAEWCGIMGEANFLPFARALLGVPLLDGTKVGHLGGNDVEFVADPIVMSHAKSLNITIGPHAHTLPKALEAHL